MTIAEFTVLDFREQTIVVLETTPIAERLESHHRVYLYALDDFFVEIWCDILHDEIISFRPFKSSRFLEPYLEMVSIGQIEG